jgi:hypothetical protein
VNEESTQIAIAALGYSAKPVLAPTRMLLRNEPEPCSELPARFELLRIYDGGCNSACSDRTNPRYRCQAPAHIGRAVPREQPRLNSANPLSDITQLSSQHVEHFASDVRQVGPSRAERSDEPLNVAHIATNNNAELGTMSLDRTDETAALPDQKVSGSVKEQD